jgi:hypothetical protein
MDLARSALAGEAVAACLLAVARGAVAACPLAVAHGAVPAWPLTVAGGAVALPNCILMHSLTYPIEV